MRKVLLFVIRVLSLPLYIIPAKLRLGLIKGLMVLDSRVGGPDDAMRRQFQILDMAEKVIAERALAFGEGIHPKHRLTRYHDFFVDNIENASTVLDVGCGYGALARSIAARVDGAKVTGIDSDEPRLTQAQTTDNPDGVNFVLGDALKDLPDGSWDVMVLSNVWEHIEDRVGFMRGLLAKVQPTKVLIRVPVFERNWHLPMRKELGIGYFSDDTHFIEHTLAEFKDETEQSGLHILSQDIRWGEIWAVCKPVGHG
ncbi:class I SAM-dependent methyltransferase [Magnetovibrio sp. PR-2]|uniref:class I SAM-dependent methyltransferase n=1 Tax=Magnetovibrio sp. PR-2 TaxID=3120356 RepID=UPI002FCDE285